MVKLFKVGELGHSLLLAYRIHPSTSYLLGETSSFPVKRTWTVQPLVSRIETLKFEDENDYANGP